MRRKDTHPRDRLDLSPKLLLDPVESEPVVVGNEVDGNTEVTKSATVQLELKIIHCHLTFHCGQSCAGRSQPSWGSRS